MVILSVLKRCRQVQKLVGSQSWDLILFVPQLLKKHRIFDVETWHRFQQISKGLGIDVAESNDLADVHKQQVSGSVLWPFFMSPLPTLHSSCYFTCFSTCLTCLVISGLFVSVPGCCDEADLSCFVGSATFTSLQFSCVSWVLPVIGHQCSARVLLALVKKLGDDASRCKRRCVLTHFFAFGVGSWFCEGSASSL